MPIQTELFKQKVTDLNIQLDTAMVFFKKFMDDPRFYQDKLSKTFFKYYTKHGLNEVQLILQKIQREEEKLQANLKKIQDEQQTIFNQLKSDSGWSEQNIAEMEKLKVRYIKLEHEIGYTKKLIDQKIEPEMILTDSNRTLTDHEILYTVFHYAGATCNRSAKGIVAYAMQCAYSEIIDEKAKPLTFNQAFLASVIETFAIINNCAANGAKLMLKLNNPSNHISEIKAFTEIYVLMYKNCTNAINDIIKCMQTIINHYFEAHPEAFILERIKDSGSVDLPHIELSNLVVKMFAGIKSLRNEENKLYRALTAPPASNDTGRQEHKIDGTKLVNLAAK